MTKTCGVAGVGVSVGLGDGVAGGSVCVGDGVAIAADGDAHDTARTATSNSRKKGARIGLTILERGAAHGVADHIQAV
ncbi:MAG TPA: hypothetical protein VKE23_02800 [Candidatus Limnocylindria bacterium]|nr:hypothetical protein [Candidatus Limnocylindria bacterium]